MLFTFIIKGESLIIENFSPLDLQQGVPCKGLAQPPLLQQDRFVPDKNPMCREEANEV